MNSYKFITIILSLHLYKFSILQATFDQHQLMMEKVQSVLLTNTYLKCTMIIIFNKSKWFDESNSFLELNLVQLINVEAENLNNHSYYNAPKRKFYNEQHYYHFRPHCNIIMYHLNNPQLDFITLQTNYWSSVAQIMPGRIFNTYHFIIAERPAEILQESFVKLMYNLVILDSNTGELTTSNKWFTKLVPLTPNHNIWKNKWKDFHGASLILATTDDLPREELEAYEKPSCQIGSRYQVKVSYEFLKYLNATPVRLNNITILEHGTQINKTARKWSGSIGAVIEGQAHFGTAAAILSDRAQVVYFSKPYYYDRFMFIVGLPKKVGVFSESIASMLIPFELPVWLGILGCIIILFIGLKFMDPKLLKNDNLVLFGYLIKPGFDQSVVIKSKHNVKSLCIFSLWFLIIILLNSIYKTVLTSIMISPTFTSPPRTFSELRGEPNYDVGGLGFKDVFLTEADVNLWRTILGEEALSRMKRFSLFTPECYKLILNDHQICIGISNIMRIFAEVSLTDESGQPQFQLSKDEVNPFTAGFPIPFHFPFILPGLNIIIGRMESQGFLGYWIELDVRLFKLNGQKATKASLKNLTAANNTALVKNEEADQDKYIQPIHFLKALLYGFSFSILAFIFEIIIYNYYNGCYNLKSMIRKYTRNE